MRKLTQRQRDLYEKLAQYHAVEHKTFAEVAQMMSVGERTLRRWAKTEEYQHILEEMRAEWRAQSATAVENIALAAIRVLVELMNDRTVRPHVRFEAAKALGDWAGLGQQRAPDREDDRAALIELYRVIEESKQPTINVQLPPGTTIATPPQLPAIEARVIDSDAPS